MRPTRQQLWTLPLFLPSIHTLVLPWPLPTPGTSPWETWAQGVEAEEDEVGEKRHDDHRLHFLGQLSWAQHSPSSAAAPYGSFQLKLKIQPSSFYK